MPLVIHTPRLLWLTLAALAVCAGCHHQNPMPDFWNTATRVPPPTTSSYGKAANYYPNRGSAPAGAAPAAPGTPGLPVGGSSGALPTAAPGVTPLMPPPPTVPATGSRPSPTAGASTQAPYSVTPASALPTVPPTTPLSAPLSAPTIPPTYLSTPARVDTMIQPVSGQAFDQDNGGGAAPTAAMPPANNLRWGVR
ncbi:MAG: hypothetical protein U0939_15865 [Pirellulales bacterium]